MESATYRYHERRNKTRKYPTPALHPSSKTLSNDPPPSNRKSKRPSPSNPPKLPHHARAPLPETFTMVVLAVDSTQAREVHFGFDYWVL